LRRQGYPRIVTRQAETQAIRDSNQIAEGLVVEYRYYKRTSKPKRRSDKKATIGIVKEEEFV